MDKSECCELCYEKLYKIDINEPYYRLYSDIINVFMSSGVINMFLILKGMKLICVTV